MKTIITLCIALGAYVAVGQTKDIPPRSEFTIDLSDTNLVLKPGESKSVTVLISRSKYYANVKAKLGFSSALPKGVTAEFEPKEGNFESSILTIKVSSETGVGNYSLVPDASLNHKTKGTILKLTVTNDQVAAR